jgi:hypothetical protein
MLKRSLTFFSQENSLSALLIFMIIRLFVLVPATGWGVILAFATDVVFFLFLLAGGLLMAHRRPLRISLSTLIVLSIILRTTRTLFDLQFLKGGDFIVSTLALAGMVILIIQMVYQDGPVTSHRVRGAIVVYLLIAALFARVYALIFYFVPGSFNFAPILPQFQTEAGESFHYFSVVTLTTVGYGDITAVAPIARSFVMIEAFIGQLFPATLIARLVSLSLVAKIDK